MRLCEAIVFSTLLQIAGASYSDPGYDATTVTDVAILGGGASGTFAAVTLQDLGHSIIVIEQDDHLGGHTHSWTEPQTGTAVDVGVQVYWDYGPAKAFFARLGVDVGPKNFSIQLPNWIDATTGKNLSDYVPPEGKDVLEALETYLQLAEEYSFLLPGYWDFPSGDDIPADLLLPFGEFATKHRIEALIPLMTRLALVGIGGVRDILTFEVMGMSFGLIPSRGISDHSAFGPTSQDNSELYRKAQNQLDGSLFLSSCILEAGRNASGTQLVVQNGQGKKHLVQAKRLLVTAAPSISALSAIGLDQRETNVFETWKPRSLYAGIIQTFALPENESFYTMSSDAVPDHYLDFQQGASFLLEIQGKLPRGYGIFRVVLETKDFIPLEEARQLVEINFKKIVQARTPSVSSSKDYDLEWRQWISHNSILMRKSSEELRGGFINELYDLQGYRSTWYTGSLWSSDFSTAVWTFTESLIPRMMADFV